MDSPEGVRISGNELSDRYGAFTLGRQQGSNQYYKEAIAPEVEPLRMMLIPAGSFLMGSPADELDRRDNEGPQHEVSLSQFFMSKYPVTQAQWQAAAALPEVNRELESNPSRFKGEQLPVERVSWYEAVEFCDRLTLHTNRQYRLPTEAEWEHACRAGTTTPFYFGESITTDLANYQGTDNESLGWSGSYGDGPNGEYREKTTPVGQLDTPNAYGLCDMHGNVYEWCQDHWYDNYEGAPTDGSAWLTDNEGAGRIIRGGSWLSIPELCRSAYRPYYYPVSRSHNLGFRVSCVAPRALA
ncbi:MAG: formylglycine-generating enzyme family protein [Cyanobacteria bacterium J06560_2]